MFFFFKQKTAYEMRISDWSSDVCSSDLPDIAQVQVQNKVALATPRLPSEVVQQGVVVAKANPGFLMIAALRSSNPEYDKDALSDLIDARVLDQISRTPGFGSTQLFGGEYAMNIWLNPTNLPRYGRSALQASP